MSEAAWDRRMLLATAGGIGLTGVIGGAALAAGGDRPGGETAAGTNPAGAASTPAAPAAAGVYALPNLPYDYAALDGVMSAEILQLHHDKHHAGYVKGANATLEKLATARTAKNFDSLVGLEKTLAFNLSGHVLHSIFWMNLSPKGGGMPAGQLATAITQSFGSFDAFQAQLTAATAGVQGSGWGTLAYEPLSKRLLVEQVYDHHGNVGMGTVPLLAFDAWEHAYYLQYKNVRGDYVKKLWDVVNWADVAQRYASARKSNLTH